ncbi:MAG: SDR family oxidoreductase [Desulfobacteraceae bacterium]|nr:SDR family oxidoreductase [Desulfobacteraceae bacterium]
MPSFGLKGRIALVTGASRGIGRAIAETLANSGAEVVLVSRKIAGLETVSEKIRHNDGKAVCFACHMGKLAEIEKLYDYIQKKYGRLDILVNNAATNPHFGDIFTVDEGIWNKTLDVNLKGPFFMIQKAIALMQAAGQGAIVNISSVNGIRPAPMQGVYSITKGALITMTRTFAKELASSNIRVNAVLPGFTDTKFTSVLMENKQIYDMVVNQIPLKRHADPDEISGAVLYLVSDAASYTTGACLACDGGILA